MAVRRYIFNNPMSGTNWAGVSVVGASVVFCDVEVATFATDIDNHMAARRWAFSEAAPAESIKLLATKMVTEVLSARNSLAVDEGKRLRTTSGSGVNYTVVNGVHAVDDEIVLVQGGTGNLALVAGTDVTINHKDGGLSLDGQHAKARLICESVGVTDVFTLTGDVVV